MGLTDKHLAYGDDVPQTQTEKDYYWKIKHLEEQNNKLKEAIQKVKEEIKFIQEAEIQVYGKANWNFSGKCLDIIDKHLSEVNE